MRTTTDATGRAAGFETPSSAPSKQILLYHLGILALVRALSSMTVLLSGFRAVSDDDFARIVIAQEWAASPRLDPSGTSWLPLPFWITGTAMRLFGRGEFVAYATSALLGLFSTWLIYIAAHWITQHRKISLVGAALATILPWSARLGIAPVPELFASALALLAAASTVPPAPPGFPQLRAAAPRLPLPNRLLAGATCLSASTLCRYDAWPIAPAFAAFAFACAFARAAPTTARLRYILAALLALLAPALWIAWNHHAHGSATHFLERVAAYRRALGAGQSGSLRTLFAYPEAFIRHEPEVVGTCVLLACALIFGPRIPSIPIGARLRRYTRPASFFLLQLILLSAALIRDGAPTHHAERALLAAMLLLSVLTGELALHLHERLQPLTLRAFPHTAPRALIAALLIWIIPTALLIRPWIRREDFVPRVSETQLGRAAAHHTKPGERILLEVNDYGYFAVIAAFARPEDIVLDRSADPRTQPSRSSFDDPQTLRERLQTEHIRYIIARPEHISGLPPYQTLARAGHLALIGPIEDLPHE